MQNYWLEIQKEYDLRRENSKIELENRKINIYKEIPEIKNLDAKITSLGLKYGRLIIQKKGMNVNKEIGELKDKIEFLTQQKKTLLKNHGYPENYLKIKYLCSKCKDTGYINKDGTTKFCICLKQLLINKMYTFSNLNTDNKIGFDFFDETLYSDKSFQRGGQTLSARQNILKIRDKCINFINNFENPECKNMFFHGSTGIGKTFMSKSVALEILKKGHSVLYLSAPQLFEIIYAGKYGSKSTFTYQTLLEVDLLIIDDLGTESPSDAKYAELLTILNLRSDVSSRKPSKMIISSNMNIKTLRQNYSERITSRIIGEFDILDFIGDDIRLLKRLADS